MRFISRIATQFYILIMLFFSVATLFFVFQVIPLHDVSSFLEVAYSDNNLRLVIGGIAILLILINYIFATIISGNHLREKTIAFDNPSGRVTISLVALEDMLRRTILRMPEVKELRPNVVATKKGLFITVRLVRRSDVSIPEVTSRIQETIKRKIQDTVGLEETISVKIHVTRIVTSDEIRSKKPQEPKFFEDDIKTSNYPFRGYRA